MKLENRLSMRRVRRPHASHVECVGRSLSRSLSLCKDGSRCHAFVFDRDPSRRWPWLPLVGASDRSVVAKRALRRKMPDDPPRATRPTLLSRRGRSSRVEKATWSCSRRCRIGSAKTSGGCATSLRRRRPLRHFKSQQANAQSLRHVQRLMMVGASSWRIQCLKTDSHY